MQRCFNWKVIVGLAALGLGIYVVAPGLIGSALPILLVLICPLSMLLMGGMMGGRRTPAKADDRMEPIAATSVHPCPMHPDVRNSHQGVGPRWISLRSLTTPIGRAEEGAAREPASSRDGQLRDRRARLEMVPEQQAALAQQIAPIEAADLSALPPDPGADPARRSTSSWPGVG